MNQRKQYTYTIDPHDHVRHYRHINYIAKVLTFLKNTNFCVQLAPQLRCQGPERELFGGYTDSPRPPGEPGGVYSYIHWTRGSNGGLFLWGLSCWLRKHVGLLQARSPYLGGWIPLLCLSGLLELGETTYINNFIRAYTITIA